jgi:hypothetical protein
VVLKPELGLVLAEGKELKLKWQLGLELAQNGVPGLEQRGEPGMDLEQMGAQRLNQEQGDRWGQAGN